MPTNVERLDTEGLLDPSGLGQDDLDAINNDLTTAEVDALISVHQKLSPISGDLEDGAGIPL